MTAYEVLVEGVFVRMPEEHGCRYGFHSTFFLEANNAPNAAHRVGPLVKDRLESNGVRKHGPGVFESYFWVHDIWEVADERLPEDQAHDLGFTFFRIGLFESIWLYLRRLLLSKFRPWLLVYLQ